MVGGIGGGNQHLAQGDLGEAGVRETGEKIAGLLLISAESVGIVILLVIGASELGNAGFGLIFGGVI